MTESPDAPNTDRIARFERAVAELGHRPGRHERQLAAVGVVVMAIGVVVAVVAYATSLGHSDQRDVVSSGILAVVGVSLVVAGTAIYLRNSLVQFLRFWMLRLLAAQDEEDR